MGKSILGNCSKILLKCSYSWTYSTIAGCLRESTLITWHVRQRYEILETFYIQGSGRVLQGNRNYKKYPYRTCKFPLHLFEQIIAIFPAMCKKYLKYLRYYLYYACNSAIIYVNICGSSCNASNTEYTCAYICSVNL